MCVAKKRTVLQEPGQSLTQQYAILILTRQTQFMTGAGTVVRLYIATKTKDLIQ